MDDPIDRRNVEQLGARFGNTLVAQLIDLFIVQGQERITAARAAAAAGDGRAVSAVAHSLKSSAGNLGANSLGALAAKIERDSPGERAPEALGALVTELSAAFEDACSVLRSIRDGAAGPGDVPR